MEGFTSPVPRLDSLMSRLILEKLALRNVAFHQSPVSGNPVFRESVDLEAYDANPEDRLWRSLLGNNQNPHRRLATCRER